MSAFYVAVAVFLFANILAGLGRVVRGPSSADRMLSANLFGTTGVGILLLLAEATEAAALRDVALVFAALAAVAVSIFVSRPRASGERAR
ncbi:MAG TPA: monovalent cation/H+ antiporter complex subunit F [Myxococcaceae bacterium]|nr:monovalent cation/H+ antiporter complex subunit F [Myxococcaceae bacterium]